MFIGIPDVSILFHEELVIFRLSVDDTRGRPWSESNRCESGDYL